jgi:hypothetical protein
MFLGKKTNQKKGAESIKSVAKGEGKGKKRRVLKPVEIVSAEQYQDLPVDARIEVIQTLIPLGLMHVQEELCREVERLAGGGTSGV